GWPPARWAGGGNRIVQLLVGLLAQRSVYCPPVGQTSGEWGEDRGEAGNRPPRRPKPPPPPPAPQRPPPARGRPQHLVRPAVVKLRRVLGLWTKVCPNFFVGVTSMFFVSARFSTGTSSCAPECSSIASQSTARMWDFYY